MRFVPNALEIQPTSHHQDSEKGILIHHDVDHRGRPAGRAATGMLLRPRACARSLSTRRRRFRERHAVQPPATAARWVRLCRWGLRSPGWTAPCDAANININGVVLAVCQHDGATALYSPRREVLDTCWSKGRWPRGSSGGHHRRRAAVWEDPRSRRKGSSSCRWMTAPALVVGADGKHSIVARTVGAPSHRSGRLRSLGFL